MSGATLVDGTQLAPQQLGPMGGTEVTVTGPSLH